MTNGEGVYTVTGPDAGKIFVTVFAQGLRRPMRPRVISRRPQRQTLDVTLNVTIEDQK